MPNQICPLCVKQASVIVPSDGMFMRFVECSTCGRYAIDMQLADSGFDEANDKRHVLSYLTRGESDAGRFLKIKVDNFKAMIGSVPDETPLEKLDRVLLLYSKTQKWADQYVELDFNANYPLVLARDKEEFQALKENLVQQKLLQATSDRLARDWRIRLTPDGWKRAKEIAKLQGDSDQAFVAMWFHDSVSQAWTDGIKVALEATEYKPLRIDQVQHNDKIDDRIVAEIRRSSLLVADVTGQRPGVYFEAGFAKGLNMDVIWTCRETDIGTVHFDTRQFNHIVWREPTDLKLQLADRIAATIPGRRIDEARLGRPTTPRP
ncbi:MAG: hypothetical protein FJ319_04855 [SAR202 cluster bacterium]|nr:hypothetical protein [SAR202 cluster bacterium]